MIREHLESRHIQVSRYDLWIDDEANIATFPLWNLSKQLVGYQRYNPAGDKTRSNAEHGRYYTWISKPKIGVWGLETFYYKKDILFLTEGIFDACRLHNRDLPAIAVLANDPKIMKSWIRSLGRKIIVISDNDKAGQKLNKFGDLVLTTGKKDLGDSSEEDIDKLLINM